jgi:plastocyanin
VRPRFARLAVAVAACQLLSTTSAQSTATFTSATASASLTSQNGCQLVSTALAQSASSAISLQVVTRTASAKPSATSRPQNYKIKVGSGGFVFDPPELKNVSVGSTVTFEFYPPDHSVIQAEFGSACVPYSYADSEHQGKGFWTPLQYVDFTNVSDNLPSNTSRTSAVFTLHQPLPLH